MSTYTRSLIRARVNGDGREGPNGMFDEVKHRLTCRQCRRLQIETWRLYSKPLRGFHLFSHSFSFWGRNCRDYLGHFRGHCCTLCVECTCECSRTSCATCE